MTRPRKGRRRRKGRAIDASKAVFAPAARARTNADEVGLPHFETFRALVMLGSQKAAADHVKVAQPTASRHIRRVQEYFGHGLLRPGGGAQLSVRGEMAMEAIETAVMALTRMRDRLSPSGPVLRLGFIRAARLLVERALRRQTERPKGPAFDVRLYEMSNAALSRALLSRELDIAICYATDALARADLEQSTVVDEPPVLAIPDHAWVRGAVSAKALNPLADVTLRHGELPEVRRAKVDWYAHHGVKVKRTIECDSGGELVAYAGAGYGYGLLPGLWSLANHPGVMMVPLPGFPTVTIAAYSLRHVGPLVAQLRENLSAAARAALSEFRGE